MNQYQAGRRAFRVGLELSDNPHKNDENDCDDFADWCNGWHAAEDADNEERAWENRAGIR